MVKLVDGILKKISIRKRIYISFSLLVLLFVVNCAITVLTINRNNRLYEHVRNVIDPSLDGMDKFRETVVESKMYSTNWVFLRKNDEDRRSLLRIHNNGYELRSKLAPLAVAWQHESWKDSLARAFRDFNQLLQTEKKITGSLKEFEDYNDPFIKLEAERIVEDEVIPQTNALLAKLNRIVDHIEADEAEQTTLLESYSYTLKLIVTFLAAVIICLGLFLSVYMTKIIIGPIRVILDIINDLGKGIIRKIEPNQNKDEIGRMVRSVNRLSESLMATTHFAHSVGKRIFTIPFEPLSGEDTLGKALIAMRDDIQAADEKLNEAQRLAHLGNWERDIQTDTITMSDEMFNIMGLDPVSFDGSFQTVMSLIHPDDVDGFRKMGRAQLEQHNTIAFECRIITGSGIEKVLYIQSEILTDSKDGRIRTFGVIQDITAQKTAGLEREKILAEIIQRNKSLEQFAYIVSHNLRAPVANILGLSNILDDDGFSVALDDKMKIVNGITESVKKLDEVIMDLNSILEVKQQVHEKMERIKLQSLIDYIQVTFNKFFTDGTAELVTDLSHPPEVITLKSYLFSVFYNLVSNSIKYRRPGVKLIVSIKSHIEDDQIVLVFSDNGKGIDLDRDGEKVFGLYKRFDTTVEGRGVGLFMVRTQVEALGGTIRVKSRFNDGATFTVRLPHNLA